MSTVGKSTLLGFNYKLIGFCYVPHPEAVELLAPAEKIQITFFEQQSSAGRYLLCMSDVSKKQARQFAKILKQRIGQIVGAEEVIPYVQRSVDGTDLAQFKQMMNQSFDGVQW